MTVKAKILFVATILFISCAATFFEPCYHRTIRILFSYFTQNKIEFYGKDFNFLPDIIFISTCVIYFIIAIILLSKNKKNFILKIITAVSFFCSFTIFVCAFLANMLIIECTACKNGIRIITARALEYNAYFIGSLLFSLLPFVIPFAKDFIISTKKKNVFKTHL